MLLPFSFFSFSQFRKNLYGNMRPVILQGIKVVEQAHGLFSLVGEHQLEVRESLPRVKLGFFPSLRNIRSHCRPCPPCRRMEGQDCQTS